MKIALAQMKISECILENYDKSVELIQAAAKEGARLICFPEIQLSPFFPQYAGRDASRWVVPMDSPYIRRICGACEAAGIYAAPNFYVEDGGRRYDMSLLIDDKGTILGRQEMVHIAQAAPPATPPMITVLFIIRLPFLRITVCDLSTDRHSAASEAFPAP